jgi:chemotaxis protein CheX
MTSLNDHLGEVGENIWSQTLGVPLVPCDPTEPASGTPTLQGQVQITGGWQGTLILQCSQKAARRAAESMFDRRDDSLTQDDIYDTVGELTNMLGGTVKSMIASDGCFLSLPVVIEGTDYHVRALNTKVIARQSFDDSGETVVVTVLEALR